MTHRYLTLFIATIFCISAGVFSMSAGRIAATASDSIPAPSKAQLDSLRQKALVDSLMSKDLGEVTVEAENTRLAPTATVYLPTSSQKNAAQNMAQLLQFMAIPKIRVDLQNNSITDNFGRNIAIFINYLPATAEDQEGLRTADVHKVEYLEFPSDPRYRGAERVLNFFVQEYEYGGYTKLSSRDAGTRSFHSDNTVFSKFAYKKMTFDLLTRANYFNDSHYGAEQDITFRIPDSEGKVSVIDRKMNFDKGRLEQLTLPVTFRATYQTDKVQIRNTLGYSLWNEPNVGYSGEVYNSAYDPSTGNYASKSVYRSHNFSYKGDFFFSLPRNFSLSVNPGFQYSRNKSDFKNLNFIIPDIASDRKENAYSAQLSVNLRKLFGHHSLNLDVKHDQSHNNVRQFNNLGFYNNRFHRYSSSAELTYQYQLPNFAILGEAGLNWDKTDMNGKHTSELYPELYLFSGYLINNKSVVNFEFHYRGIAPGASNRVESISQSNEMMYETGNPLLRNYNRLDINLSYGWYPSNRFSLDFHGSLLQEYDRILYFYSPYNNGTAVIRSPENNGDFYKYTVGTSLRFYFLNNRMNISFTPDVIFYKSTGLYRANTTEFTLKGAAFYSIKQFYVSGDVIALVKEMSPLTTQVTKYRPQYSLKVGWGNSSWNVALSAANFFNDGFLESTGLLNTPMVTRENKNYNLSFSRLFSISATYTFGYGKKIKRGDEVGAQSGASSIVTQ